MSLPKVSLIVSNINGLRLGLLKNCINSLIKPNYKNWELIVVDNASSDESVKYLKYRFRKYNNCFIVENPNNIYSLGLNLGAQKASGKYLAYFNNDTKISSIYLAILIKEFEKDKQLAIAQGKLLNYYKKNILDSVGETMDIYGNPVTIGIGEKDQKQYDFIEEILSASGSACMIKKSIFDQVGGYDASYGIGYEDMDLALRIRRCGYKIKRFPKAIIYHKRAATDLAPFIKIKVKWHFNKNRIITMIKNYPLTLLLTTLPITILLYIGIIFYEWFFRKNWKMGWARTNALLWCFINLPQIIIKRSQSNKTSIKYLGKKELRLFSTKNLFDIFLHFNSIK